MPWHGVDINIVINPRHNVGRCKNEIASLWLAMTRTIGKQ